MLLKIASCFLKIESLSFRCFVFYLSNVFFHSDFSFLIFQLSLLYYYHAYLVIEMDKTFEAVIKECERKLNEATVCFPKF